jgi:hypothetical protein
VPEPRKRIYLAGPMSGMKHHNAAAFAAFKRLWTAMGWDVLTPIELNSRVWERHHQGAPFDPYTMDVQYGHSLIPEMFLEDVKAILCDVDAIALLPGWEHSEGVSRELGVATLFKKDIYDALTSKPIDLMWNVEFAVSKM